MIDICDPWDIWLEWWGQPDHSKRKRQKHLQTSSKDWFERPVKKQFDQSDHMLQNQQKDNEKYMWDDKEIQQKDNEKDMGDDKEI